MLKKKAADVFTWFFIAYLAAAAVALAPVDMPPADAARLTGKVMTWEWARRFSILPNTYALIFLAGGAARSAIQYARRQNSGNRAVGNWLIAIGALLPGIGGSFTRFGCVEVLFVTEFIGLSPIRAGYRVMTPARHESIHPAQPLPAD